MPELDLRDGHAWLDGEPIFLVTAEYPYFRDDPTRWPDRLTQIRQIGAHAVSTYIPWRHHAIGGPECEYDFTGTTDPSRNLVAFIAACEQAGLVVVAKPGPFCHAELDYGGLPDFVSPTRDHRITPMLDRDGEPITWPGPERTDTGQPARWPLPSPFCPVYRERVDAWLSQVRDILATRYAPAGPIVALQIGNEGIYSDANHAVWAHDYSEPAVTAYRKWLADRPTQAQVGETEEGSTTDPPRACPPEAQLRELVACADWADWQGHALGSVFEAYAQAMDAPVPMLTNVNPPIDADWGIDAWLSRVRPELWRHVRYGYTNWIGIAAGNSSALGRYLMLTRRAPGPNMEENWGFTAPYDERYRFPSTCFQQTLVAIAGGATGYNIYPATATQDWGDHLDTIHPLPYPSPHTAIDIDGTITEKGELLTALNGFLRGFGAEMLACKPRTPVAWIVYRPATSIGAWAASAGSAGHPLDITTPRATGPAYLDSAEQLRGAGLDMTVCDLETTSTTNLREYAALIVPGAPWMAADLQHKLATYVEAGGCLAVLGTTPTFGSDLRPLTRLANAPHLHASTPSELIGQLTSGPLRGHGAVNVNPANAGEAWLREHPDQDVQYLAVVTRDTTELSTSFTTGDTTRTVAITLAPNSGALVRLEGGQISAALVKGVDESTGTTVTPTITLLSDDAVIDQQRAPTIGDQVGLSEKRLWRIFGG